MSIVEDVALGGEQTLQDVLLHLYPGCLRNTISSNHKYSHPLTWESIAGGNVETKRNSLSTI